jgi:hypothetical protein
MAREGLAIKPSRIALVARLALVALLASAVNRRLRGYASRQPPRPLHIRSAPEED